MTERVPAPGPPPVPAYVPPPTAGPTSGSLPAYRDVVPVDRDEDDDEDDEDDDVDEWDKARRRHRRQTVTFAGSLALVLVVGLLAYLTFLGRIPWPFGGKVNTAVSLCKPSKPLAPKTVSLRVYNGSDRKGLATAVTKQLQAFGFVVEDTGNDPLESKLKTPIQVRHGDTGGLGARTVAAYLVGKVEDVVDDRQSESVDVVLGPSFTRVKTRKEVTASLAALSASLPPTCPPGVTDGASPGATPTGTPHPTGTRTSGPTKKPAAATTKK